MIAPHPLTPAEILPIRQETALWHLAQASLCRDEAQAWIITAGQHDAERRRLMAEITELEGAGEGGAA
ncbi:MAG: hypothetical protein KAX46_12840 [Chromatiaceae bacterium]|nr:hypothetical protein [Chromatiaceae bacterium]